MFNEIPAGTDPTAPGAEIPMDPAALMQEQMQPPDPYADKVKQLEMFREVKKQALEGRSAFERKWWQILMYLLRRQWMYYDTKRNQWRDKRLAKWIPKPVNTKMNEGHQALRSMFATITHGTIVRPNGNDPLNVTTAEVADGLEPLIKDEHKIEAVWAEADFWLTALGNVILHPWWDAEEGDIVMLPALGCLDCGQQYPPGTVEMDAESTCEGCGSVNMQPVPGSEQPINQGRGRTDVASPLEILIPAGYQNWEDVRELIRARWRTKSYYQAHHPDYVERIQWTKAPQERSLQMLKSLATQSDMTSSFSAGSSSETGDNEGTVEYEMWVKPTPEFPQGYVGRFIGEGDDPILLEDPKQSLPGPIPYRDKNDQPLWHWLHVGYDTFGGRLWAQGPMEGVIPLVDKLNRLDSRIELIVDRMSNPIWLEPKGADVERITGEPGIRIKYHALGANGLGKPERIDGANIPQSLFVLREQYEQEIENALGTRDVMKGERPPSIEAYSALQLLVEQGQKQFTSVFKARGLAHQQWFTLALEMERNFGREERTKALLGPNRTWSFDIFKKADLGGSVVIIVEDGTTVPKTALGKRAAIDHANVLKLINPLDPDQNFAIMSDLGLKNLVPRMDKSISAALREQHLYEEWVKAGRMEGESPLRRIDYVDDDPVHAAQHKMWATGDAIRDLMLGDPQAMKEIQVHIWEHANGAFQQQMVAQTSAGGAPAGGGGGGEGAGQAMANSNQESGNPGDEGRTGNQQVLAG